MTGSKVAVKDTTSFEGLADLLKTPARVSAPPATPRISAKIGSPAKSTPRRRTVAGRCPTFCGC
jgi:hypothetical protein